MTLMYATRTVRRGLAAAVAAVALAAGSASGAAAPAGPFDDTVGALPDTAGPWLRPAADPEPGASPGPADPEPGAPPEDAVAPEADIAHHGRITLDDGRLDLVVVSRNHGPSSLRGVTLRVELSAAPAGELRMPEQCLREAERVVLCAVGPLHADGTGRTTVLSATAPAASSEMTVRVSTAWSGGATDRNPGNDEHRVLVLATGDPYVF
ncbi:MULTISPECIES: hypothetical protein [Streptomyces]|uniref:Secreted protein n=1 Tax=Streptomyces sanyensis TaxID=568869 RepID=A0ABP9BDS0_9ACTN